MWRSAHRGTQCILHWVGFIVRDRQMLCPWPWVFRWSCWRESAPFNVQLVVVIVAIGRPSARTWTEIHRLSPQPPPSNTNAMDRTIGSRPKFTIDLHRYLCLCVCLLFVCHGGGGGEVFMLCFILHRRPVYIIP